MTKSFHQEGRPLLKTSLRRREKRLLSDKDLWRGIGKNRTVRFNIDDIAISIQVQIY